MTPNLLQNGIKNRKLVLSDAAFWAWVWMTYFEAVFIMYYAFAPFLHARYYLPLFGSGAELRTMPQNRSLFHST